MNDALGAVPNVPGASGSDITYRVTVDVVAADRSTIANVAGLVDGPSLVTVFGTAATASGPRRTPPQCQDRPRTRQCVRDERR